MISEKVRHKDIHLSYNRFWSSPEHIEIDTFIAVVICKNPCFEDILEISARLGIDRVKRVFEEVKSRGEIHNVSEKITARALRNIEKGFDDAS